MSYMGNLMSLLARGDETGGRFTLVEVAGKIGTEPPPHFHLWEHEIYYLLEGTLEFFIEGEDRSFTVQPGQTMVIPQGTAHAMFGRSSGTIRTLVATVAAGEHPVGFDRSFLTIGTPATSLEVPADMTTYAMADPQRAIESALMTGTAILTPEQVKERLPLFPGFGSNLPGASAEKQ